MERAIDILFCVRRITDPVPLKHHTETAYILVLAVVIVIAGFTASMLPSLPQGILLWAAAMAVTVLYPLILGPTFRDNRVDYELRLLHWFPAGIFFLWLLLEGFGPKLHFAHILKLGFFFLWSLPLVALGLIFLILFALQVLRRHVLRITLLSVLLGLFLLGAVYGEFFSRETFRMKRKLEAFDTEKVAMLRTRITSALAPLSWKVAGGGSGSMLAKTETDGALGSDTLLPSVSEDAKGQSAELAASLSSSVASLASSKSSLSVDALQAKGSLAPAMAKKKPGDLAASGPEDAALLFVTLLALYSIVLHVRARSREV